jgi:hypothetical protein
MPRRSHGKEMATSFCDQTWCTKEYQDILKDQIYQGKKKLHRPDIQMRKTHKDFKCDQDKVFIDLLRRLEQGSSVFSFARSQAL